MKQSNTIDPSFSIPLTYAHNIIDNVLRMIDKALIKKSQKNPNFIPNKSAAQEKSSSLKTIETEWVLNYIEKTELELQALQPGEKDHVLNWLTLDLNNHPTGFFNTVDPVERLKLLVKEKKTNYGSHQEYLHNFLTHEMTQNPRVVKYGLFYHEMGSGKTCTATFLSQALCLDDQIEHIYVLVPNAVLVFQFMRDFHIVCSFVDVIDKYQVKYEDEQDAYVKSKITATSSTGSKRDIMFHIMSYNKYLSTPSQNIDPTVSALFVDEAHNFRCTNEICIIGDALSNMTLNNQQEVDIPMLATKYDKEHMQMLLKKDNVAFQYVMFMTGTPVFNDDTDFVVLLNNMLYLTGQQDKIITKSTYNTFITQNSKKHKFVDKTADEVSKYFEAILQATGGFISRVRITDIAATLSGDKQIPSIDFSQHYYNYDADFTGKLYNINMDAEIKSKIKNGLSSKPIKVPMHAAEYNQLFSPEYKHNCKSKAKISWSGDQGISKTRAICNTDYKIERLYDEIKTHWSTTRETTPVLVYTCLLDTVQKIKNYLTSILPTAERYVEYEKDTKNPKSVAVISGTDCAIQQKLYILNAYNSPQNRNGDIIKICIITSAASTGITFRNTRQLHIVEPDWSFSLLQQVTGRAVRSGVFDVDPTTGTPFVTPHVKIFTYLSTKPTGQAYDTIEEEIFEMMCTKMRYVETFSTVLYNLSVEKQGTQNYFKNRQQILPPAPKNFRIFKVENQTEEKQFKALEKCYTKIHSILTTSVSDLQHINIASPINSARLCESDLEVLMKTYNSVIYECNMYITYFNILTTALANSPKHTQAFVDNIKNITLPSLNAQRDLVYTTLSSKQQATNKKSCDKTRQLRSSTMEVSTTEKFNINQAIPANIVTEINLYLMDNLSIYKKSKNLQELFANYPGMLTFSIARNKRKPHEITGILFQ